jgi:hypothetical protein
MLLKEILFTSNTLEQGQILYSFRHSGTIETFKRIGAIRKLQKAMGYSSIRVRDLFTRFRNS